MTRSLSLFALMAALTLTASAQSSLVLTAALDAGASTADAAALASAVAPSQEADLVPAAHSTFDDQLGWDVALFGDRALISARLDDRPGLTNAGAAYIFRRSGSTWVEEATLVASDAEDQDQFGYAVALSDDVAVIGASYADSPTVADIGAVYIFRRTGTSWAEEAILTIPNPTTNDRLGTDLSLSGDRLLVGAGFDDSDPGTGTIYGNGGSAVIYKNTGTTWSFEAQLFPSDPGNSDQFGISAALHGDRAILGAFRDDDFSQDSGAAYVFAWDGTAWVEEAKLLSVMPRFRGEFGTSVALSADHAVVGATGDDKAGATGTVSGAAYIFARTGTTWALEQTLSPSLSAAGDNVGKSVAISGNTVVVGSQEYDGAVTNSRIGAAFVYQPASPTTWALTSTLASSRTTQGGRFGWSVDVDADRVIVGGFNMSPPGFAPGGGGAAFVFADIDPTVQEGLFNPTSAGRDGAGWRLLGPPRPNVTVTEVAAMNLVQGIAAGADPATAPAQYPLAGANLFDDYTGTPVVGFTAPDADDVLAPGRGFYWYFYDRDVIPDPTSAGGGTSVGYELTGFFLRAAGSPPPMGNQSADFPDNVGPGEDDFQMIANPFDQPLQISGINPVSGSITGGGVVQVYDTATGTFRTLPTSDYLGVWQGAWAELVPNTVGRTVTLDYNAGFTQPTATPPFYGRTAAAPQIALTLSGTLSDGTSVTDQAATVRFMDGAEADWDLLDVTKLTPPQAGYALLAPMTIRDGQPYALALDSRPAGEPATVPLAVTTTNAATLALAWDVTLPDGWTATLRDMDSGAEVDMVDGARYAFTADAALEAAERFTVVVAPIGATDSDGDTPAAMTLAAPFPNPTAGTASVRWSLTEAGSARLVLLDALGRTVAVLANGTQPAGPIMTRIETADLAPGVYVVRLETGASVESVPLTVLR